jgi:hypothetical protein
MLEQPSLFDVNSIANTKQEEPGPNATKICRRCREVKDLESFPTFSTAGSSGRKNTCKQCSNELAVIRNKLRKLHPAPPPGNCPACNRYTSDWVLDHCHHTEQFRGYICDSCNLGFGKFDDDPQLMAGALSYLFRFKPHDVIN